MEAEIGVFGGSGFYSFLEDVEEVEIDTPYGKPSAPFTTGEVGGKRVAFLPRHGRNQSCPARDPLPGERLGDEGARRAAHHRPQRPGALKAELELGEFVVCDQFVDRTSGRKDTFYDGPETTHVSAADPYCPDARRLLVDKAEELGIKVRDGGTVVVIQGPRFSTRAESKWFQAAGFDTINMTAFPEGYLARAGALLREHFHGHRPRRRRGGHGARLSRAGRDRVQREQRAPARAAVRRHPEDSAAAGRHLCATALEVPASSARVVVPARVIKLRAAASGLGWWGQAMPPTLRSMPA